MSALVIKYLKIFAADVLYLPDYKAINSNLSSSLLLKYSIKSTVEKSTCHFNFGDSLKIMSTVPLQ